MKSTTTMAESLHAKRLVYIYPKNISSLSNVLYYHFLHHNDINNDNNISNYKTIPESVQINN